MFLICSHQGMTNLQHARLIEHIDAAMTAMAPATAARLAHPDRAQRRTAIAIMAQTLASRIEGDRELSAASDAASLPLLPIELR